jgi:hypothetical protein
MAARRAPLLAIVFGTLACTSSPPDGLQMQLIRSVPAAALGADGRFTLIQASPTGDLIVLGAERPLWLAETVEEPDVLVEFEREYGDGGGIVRLEPANGDTLLVTDASGNRLSLWVPRTGLAGHLEMPPATSLEDARVLRWPDRVIVLAFRDGAREILLLRSSGTHMVIDASVPLDTRHDLSDPNRVTLGNVHGDGLWIAESRSGALSHVSQDGSVVSSIDRTPAWKRDYEFPATPDPYIAELHQDSEGRLWLYWRVAHAGTGPALIQASRADRLHDHRRLYDTVVEVLDPATGKIRARGYVDAYVVTVLPDGRAVFYRRDANDGAAVGIYRLAM